MSRFHQLKGRIRSANERGSSALEFVIFLGFFLLLTIVLVMTINGSLKDQMNWTRRDSAKAPPTAPKAEPSLVSTPVDLSWLWISLSILGAMVLLGALGFFLSFVIRRSRYASLELKEKRAAIAEDRRKALAIWQRSVAKHEELKDKVLEIETDWDMLFSYPALVDSTVPQTRAFHSALRAADNLSSDAPAELKLTEAINELPYPQAVAKADDAWQAAWSFAQRTGKKLIPREERRKIDQILKLLRLARDSGGSEHERSVAYSRVTKLIGELSFVKVPRAALDSISLEAKPMIEAAIPSQQPKPKPRAIALAGNVN